MGVHNTSRAVRTNKQGNNCKDCKGYGQLYLPCPGDCLSCVNMTTFSWIHTAHCDTCQGTGADFVKYAAARKRYDATYAAKHPKRHTEILTLGQRYHWINDSTKRSRMSRFIPE